MKIQPPSAPKLSMVQNLRTIRDHISHEIKYMTFKQERTYLDQLLAEKSAVSARPHPASRGTDK